MKNLLNPTLILWAIFILSCQNQEQEQNGYEITGNLSGIPDSTMIYLKNTSTSEIFDSTMVIGGEFLLTGQLESEPEQILLNTIVDDDFFYSNLLIGNEKVKVEGDIKDFPWELNITGSKTQDEFNELNDLTKKHRIKRDSLVRSISMLSPEEKEEKEAGIREEISLLDDAMRALRMDYVKSNINTYTGIINLGWLKNSLPKDTIAYLYSQLSDELKSSKYARVIEVFLEEKISEIGDDFHDFEAVDRNGETVKFSDLMGNYILFNFTLANCRLSMESVEELRMIYENYSDTLEVVSFSGDPRKEVWLKSLEGDAMPWVSLWDGKGRYSETALKYGVQGYPTFFLIDPEGRIINKWSGYGKGSIVNRLDNVNNIVLNIQ